MGFSISAATALIFASLFLAFGIFYPAMANGYERVEDADAAKADQNLEQAQTDITLTNSEVLTQGMSGMEVGLVLNITNTGDTTLNVNKTDIIIDGDYKQWTNDGPQGNDDIDVTVDGDSETNLWLPGESLNITYEPTNFDANRFKVVTEHGVSVSGDV